MYVVVAMVTVEPRVLFFLVLYEVEVVSFFDSKASDEFQQLPEEEQAKLTLRDLVGVASAEREVIYYNN